MLLNENNNNNNKKMQLDTSIFKLIIHMKGIQYFHQY